jgi:phage terminase Nu1 subunit (DNA packaging protein)
VIDDDLDFEPDDDFEPDMGKGQTITRGELIRWSGLSTAHIATLIREGMPVVSKGTKRQGYKINSAAWLSWYVARKVTEATGGGGADGATFTQTKIANMESQRRLRELQIAEKEGELVPVADVEKWAAEMYSVVRSRFLAVESQVQGLSDDQKDILRVAITDALADVSGYATEDGGDAEDEDDDFESVDGDASQAKN